MKKSFVIVGLGHLGRIVAHAYKEGLLENYEFLGAYSRQIEDTEEVVDQIGHGQVCSSVEELLALRADYLVEAASIKLFKELAVDALAQGTSVIPLSIGAFADRAFYEEAMEMAKKQNAKIHIPSGAVGGFDVLQTVSLMASQGVEPGHGYGSEDGKSIEIDAEIHTHKNPRPLWNTELFSPEILEEEKEVLSGTTAEAIALLPTQVNVMVATALATKGPENTSARITTVPDFIGDDHRTEVNTAGIRAIVDIYSATSDIAGWSVVSLMRNLQSPMQFH